MLKGLVLPSTFPGLSFLMALTWLPQLQTSHSHITLSRNKDELPILHSLLSPMRDNVFQKSFSQLPLVIDQNWVNLLVPQPMRL